MKALRRRGQRTFLFGSNSSFRVSPRAFSNRKHAAEHSDGIFIASFDICLFRSSIIFQRITKVIREHGGAIVNGNDTAECCASAAGPLGAPLVVVYVDPNQQPLDATALKGSIVRSRGNGPALRCFAPSAS